MFLLRVFADYTEKRHFIHHSITIVFNVLKTSALSRDGWFLSITNPSLFQAIHHSFESNVVFLS